MGTPINDTSEWPLCRVLLPPEMMSAEDIEAHLLTLEELFARKEPFALLIDVRASVPPLARERRIIGLKVAEWYRRYPSQLVSVAILVSSGLQRGALIAIQSTAGDGFPHRAFAAPEPAEAWLRAALHATASHNALAVPTSPAEDAIAAPDARNCTYVFDLSNFEAGRFTATRFDSRSSHPSGNWVCVASSDRQALAQALEAAFVEWPEPRTRRPEEFIVRFVEAPRDRPFDRRH